MIENIIAYLRRQIIVLMEDVVRNEYTEGFEHGYMQAIEDIRMYSRLHQEPVVTKALLPPNFVQHIKMLWDDRQKIEAIKYYRTHTNAGLFEAKQACELIGGM